MTYDIAIKNGLVVDGSGAPPVRGDIGIRADRVVALGELAQDARRVIDAEGMVITPGFIDIHTHLDAQIMWDPQVTSPCWHGITSVLLGNCGLSIAPSRPGERLFQIKLLESVEDIPAESIIAGNKFEGETYGDYLDMLDELPKGVNVGGLVGHCAVRYHAMGERSMDQAAATPDDIEKMCHLVDEAMASGALGFSTSRSTLHTTPDGRHVPGTFAQTEELLALGRVLEKHGRGVYGSVPPIELADSDRHRKEIDWMAAASKETGRPITFPIVQSRECPDLWRDLLAQVHVANQQGARLCPQTEVRSIGVVVGLANITPFDQSLAWHALKPLSLREKTEALRQPERRALLVREGNEVSNQNQLSMIYQLTDDDARYDFKPEQSLWAIASARGVSPAEAFIDIQLERDGEGYFIFPFLNHDMEAVGELLSDPSMLLGLADSGAHVGQICDTSFSTYFLHYWVQERKLFTLAEGIRKLTSEPADFLGFKDRGRLREGAFADINVIELDKLKVHPPEFKNDLPDGAGRFIQRASGIAYTLVNGEVFMQDGQPTGSFSGRLLRGGG